jgi:hypothetical protein
MIIGSHVLLYSGKPEADRVFFRDVLEFRSVDVGGGWLIFELPPAEAALHPAEGDTGKVHGGRLLGAELYLMCDDLQSLIQSLEAKNVTCSPVEEARWGTKTTIPLPSGGAIGLYQPRHQMALHLG